MPIPRPVLQVTTDVGPSHSLLRLLLPAPVQKYNDRLAQNNNTPLGRDIGELLESFRKNVMHTLLFLKSVRTIQVFVLNEVCQEWKNEKKRMRRITVIDLAGFDGPLVGRLMPRQ